jgi:prepilin-type N-terminal cleavage/methylation domain-containing protein/prepilin-type processing-associated H-X9-DG protein
MYSYIRKGFTLIELLIAIAVIGLLMSILAPALSRAKHFAYEKKCAVNLRQISLALAMYADEKGKGRYPLEPTEHNPHPDLLKTLCVINPGLLEAFYCPQALYMEEFAKNTTDYIPKGDPEATDSVIDTTDNRVAGNISYVYWSFRKNKYCSGATGDENSKHWRNPSVFMPRQLTNTGFRDLPDSLPSLNGLPDERWVLSDFFRRKAPFPHAREHARGLNVVYLDGHVELVMGRPRNNYR